MRRRLILALGLATACSPAASVVSTGMMTDTGTDGGDSSTSIPGPITFTPVDGTATDPTSTTGTSSGGDTGMSTDTSGSSGEGSSSSGWADTLFQQCSMDQDCDSGESCNPYVTYCTVPCVNNSDCPEGPSSDALPRCGPSSSTCVLDCTGGATCPAGMLCKSIANYLLCAY